MMSLFFFVEDNNLQYINLDAKVHDFINQGAKEWNFTPLQTSYLQMCYQILNQFQFLLIPYNIELCGATLKMENLLLNQLLGQ